jgi:hypothetical protein
MRLAYQVIGKEGPIFNPSNIRYIPADGGNLASLSPGPDLTAGLAGVGLVASVGAVVLSAATLAEVKKLQRKVDAVLFGMEKISNTLADVASRVQRIDGGL